MEQSWEGSGIRHLESLAEKLPDLVGRISREGRYLYMSPNTRELTGLDAREFLGKRPGEMTGLSPENRRIWDQALEAVFRGEQVRFELPYQTPKGFLSWETRLYGEFSADGQIVSALSISRDVTFKKQQESLIVSSNEILEMIALGKADLESIVSLVCLELERQFPFRKFGLLMVDASREMLVPLAAPSFGPELLAALKAIPLRFGDTPCAAAALTSKPVIVPDLRLDSEWKTAQRASAAFDLASCWSWPVISRQGDVLATFAGYSSAAGSPTAAEVRLVEIAVHLAAIALEQDRSRRALRESEERLRALNENLETRVTEATQKLIATNQALEDEIRDRKEMEKWLVAARSAALEASRIKSSFVANISHEIRTPIHAITGMLYALSETSLDERQLKFARTIEKATESLMVLLNDVLDFAKMESGKLNLHFKEFDLRELLEQSTESFAREAEGKGLRWSLDVAPDAEGSYRSDASRIRQILGNIVSNAVKFTQAGEIRISVRRELVGGTRAVLSFEIRDTGIGIPEGARGKIFQEFSQVDGSATRKHAGAGLGLSICKRLAELLDGQVGYESELGKGSTFWFRIPVFLDAASHHPAPGVPELKSPEGDRSASILLVEDNPINQEVTGTLLESLGHSVTLASSGKEALALFSPSAFDLVIMDCQMPEMDGYETTRQLRERMKAQGVRIPVIAMTADAMKDAAARCLAAGMSDYLSKPVLVPVLRDKIQAWLAEGNGTAKAESSVDLSAVEKLKGFKTMGKQSLFVKLVEIYVEDAPSRFLRMKRFFDAGDLKSLQAEAHYLKSASKTLGAERLSRLCEELENLGSLSAEKSSGEVLRKFREELEPVLASLLSLAGLPPVSFNLPAL